MNTTDIDTVTEVVVDAIDTVVDAVETAISEQTEHCVEYEETHDDAGSNYAHLIREGGWTYNNCFGRIIEHMRRDYDDDVINALKEKADEFGDKLLDMAEMEPGNILGRYTGGVCLDSYALSEIELQIELSSLPLPEQDLIAEGILKHLDKNSREVCIRYTAGDDTLYSYQCSDVVWMCVISDGALETIVNEMLADDE